MRVEPKGGARTDRLEVETKSERVVLLLQTDKKMFVRSGKPDRK